MFSWSKYTTSILALKLFVLKIQRSTIYLMSVITLTKVLEFLVSWVYKTNTRMVFKKGLGPSAEGRAPKCKKN